jgi:NAD-dependent SIR2 family protein deacetylase
MSLFNRCKYCGARIPSLDRGYFGNPYKPVMCANCTKRRRIAIYGSTEAADAAHAKAIRDELKKA